MGMGMSTTAHKKRKRLEAEEKDLVKRPKKLEAQDNCLDYHDDAVRVQLDDLPENCTYNIFVCLPLESLYNLRFVSKSWHGIVNSTNFPGTRGIIFSTRVQNYSHPPKKVFSPESNSMITDRVSSFHIKFMEFNKDDGNTISSSIKEYNTAFRGRIVATCDGLVVLEKDFRTPGLILLNPVTRERQHIPLGAISSERDGDLYGLALSSRRRCYKLLRLFLKDDALGCEIMDMVASGGSWRAVDVPPTKRFHLLHSPVFAMGALHWIQYVDDDDDDDDHVDVDCMVSMRLDDDKYETTTIPSARTGGDQIQFNAVFAMGEFLGFSSRSGKSNQIQVWILRGSVECGWEKQYNIDASGLGSMIPLLYYEGDDKLVLKSGGGSYFYAYNRHSQRLTKIETIGTYAPNDYYNIFPHVNTHVSWRR